MHLDGMVRTDPAARIAARAKVHVDVVFAIGRERDGVYWAALRADRATGAIRRHFILNKRAAFSRRAFAAKVRLVFVPVIAQCREHRVGGGLAQAAQAPCADLLREAFEFIEVFSFRLARAEPFENV